MLINLSKEDLISMIMGQDPPYRLQEDVLVKRGGHWIGGFVDTWYWEKGKLQLFKEEELICLYQILTGNRLVTLNFNEDDLREVWYYQDPVGRYDKEGELGFWLALFRVIEDYIRLPSSSSKSKQ